MQSATPGDADQERLQDVTWLTSAAAVPWLEIASQMPNDGLQLMARLRRDLSPARAGLIAETVTLRQRALEKFHQAGQMFFTVKGLEQATSAKLAAYKAPRFPLGKRVADLGCGIGGDLMAIATRGPVVGVDRDACTAHLARANLKLLSNTSPASQVRNEEAHARHIVEADAWHVDPDRRGVTGRVSHPAAAQPDLAQLQQWHRLNPHMAIKLSPAVTPQTEWWGEVEWEWLGSSRHCQQLMVWSGCLARFPGQHVATYLDGEGKVAQFVGIPQPVSIADALGEFLLEPHPVVLAANLSQALGARYGIRQVGMEAGFLTGPNSLTAESLLTPFRVQEVLPFDRKRVRALLLARKIGHLEVKSKKMDATANQLAREFRNPRLTASATLIIVRHRGQATAVLADRGSG